MLCVKCKKNQATNLYERTVNGQKKTEYYCHDCYRAIFRSVENTNLEGVCPYCKTTVKEFLKTGLVGCEYCYNTLSETINPVIKRMQGDTVHVGKDPDSPEYAKIKGETVKVWKR